MSWKITDMWPDLLVREEYIEDVLNELNELEEEVQE